MSRNLVGQIDSYLQGRGSPMAGQGRTFVQAGRRYGVDPRLLVGIATIESGAGQHEKLRHNPFNWGVHRGQEYDSYDEAIADVARGLRRNYLDDGLETPQQIVSRYAPSSDGNNESNWANVVSSVMRQLGTKGLVGGATPAAPRPTTVAGVAREAAKLAPPKLEYDPLKLSTGLRDQFIAGAGRIDLGSQLPNLIEQSWSVVRPPPPPPQAQTQAPKPGSNFVPTHQVAPGQAINLPWTYKSTHVTDGLADEGFKEAIDIMGSPGTPVTAPRGGTVIYFHPTGAQGGGSMLVRFADGREGWIGHIANGLPAGAKFGAGSQLAVISSDHPRPHVHWDLRR